MRVRYFIPMGPKGLSMGTVYLHGRLLSGLELFSPNFDLRIGGYWA